MINEEHAVSKNIEFNEVIVHVLKEEEKILKKRIEVLNQENQLLKLEVEQRKEEIEEIVSSKAYRYARKLTDLLRHK